MSKGIIHVRIPKEQDLFLEFLALPPKTTKSDIIREALNTWITHLKRLEEIGVIRVAESERHP